MLIEMHRSFDVEVRVLTTLPRERLGASAFDTNTSLTEFGQQSIKNFPRTLTLKRSLFNCILIV